MLYFNLGKQGFSDSTAGAIVCRDMVCVAPQTLAATGGSADTWTHQSIVASRKLVRNASIRKSRCEGARQPWRVDSLCYTAMLVSVRIFEQCCFAVCMQIDLLFSIPPLGTE